MDGCVYNISTQLLIFSSTAIQWNNSWTLYCLNSCVFIFEWKRRMRWIVNDRSDHIQHTIVNALSIEWKIIKNLIFFYLWYFWTRLFGWNKDQLNNCTRRDNWIIIIKIRSSSPYRRDCLFSNYTFITDECIWSVCKRISAFSILYII